MNRRERRRQEKAGKKAGATKIKPVAGSGVASALMGYASGGSAAPIASGRSDPDSVVKFAISMFQAGRLAEAERGFRDVLNMAPEHAPALQLLGVTLHRQGKSEEGINLIERAIAIDPDYAEAHNNFGLMLMELGQTQAAQDKFRDAIQVKPDYADALMNLANLQITGGRPDLGRKTLEAALDHDPRHIRALSNLTALEIQTGHLDAALATIDEALSVEPKNPILLNNRGNVLLMMEQPKEAGEAFRAALASDPNYKEAQRNLLEVNHRTLQSWHFPMLVDEARNNAYDEAIRRVIGPGDRVLDIGTGSGLLALMAARAGADHVTAVEAIPELADVAQRIAEANGYGDKITVVQRNSLEMRVGEDLPEPVNVIVSEILDAGLLGEGVIPSLRHAVASLGRPGVRVLPAGATVMGQVMELPDRHAFNPLGEVSGFDLSIMNEFRNPAAYRSLQLKHEKHRALSDPFHIATFNFADLPTTERNRRAEVTITEDGQADAIVFWFDLHIDAETMVSSGLDGDLRHWGQALVYFDAGPTVAAGDQLPLLIAHTDTTIFFELL